MTPTTLDIPRTMLAVLFIGLLIAASLWILSPFLTALIWATTIVVTTWPVMISVQKHLWGKRGLAVTVMTVALLLAFFVPFGFAIVTIVDRADELVHGAKSLGSFALPPLPEWIAQLPLVGSKIAARWQQLAAAGPGALSERLAPEAKNIVAWLGARAGDVGLLIVQFLLTVILSAVLYAYGETAAGGIRSFAHRLAGQSGEDAAVLGAKAIRGVALGVIVTAVIQSVLSAIGLLVAGVPAAVLLTAVIFVLCVAQIGPGLVMIPVIIWLFYTDQTLWGTVMIPWAIFIGTVDNFIRPFLIKKGADLPLLLIFAGVIGGLLAFGVIGLFVGPVMLAVTYTMLVAWVRQGAAQQGTPPSGDQRAA